MRAIFKPNARVSVGEPERAGADGCMPEAAGEVTVPAGTPVVDGTLAPVASTTGAGLEAARPLLSLPVMSYSFTVLSGSAIGLGREVADAPKGSQVVPEAAAGGVASATALVADWEAFADGLEIPALTVDTEPLGAPASGAWAGP